MLGLSGLYVFVISNNKLCIWNEHCVFYISLSDIMLVFVTPHHSKGVIFFHHSNEGLNR
jgi:hypothetical protein